jgi:hypothetical protein
MGRATNDKDPSLLLDDSSSLYYEEEDELSTSFTSSI